MRTRLLMLMALISAGCDREQTCTTGADSVEYCILMVRQGEGGPTNWFVEASRRCREIELTTNVTERLTMLQRSADNVLATPLDDLEYDRQDRLFALIPDLVRQICHALRRSRFDVVKTYELKSRLVEWHWLQLERLRPKRRFTVMEKRRLDRNWWQWQRCYMRIFASLRSCIDSLERGYYEDATSMSDEQCQKVKRMIERSVMRTMRTEEEVKSTWDWETDEYNAVKSMMVAP